MNTDNSVFDLPAKAQKYLKQAYAYEAQALFEQALTACESAIEFVPDFAEAHNLRGLALDQLGRVEEAVVAYREAVQFDPAFEEAQKNLQEAVAELEKTKKSARGAGFWRRPSVAMHAKSRDIASPTTAQEYLKQAYDYEAQELFEQALTACEVAIELAPDFAEAHNLRGLILDQLECMDEAVTAYREAVQFDPAFEEAQKNLQEAIAELEKAKKNATIAGFWRRSVAALIDILVLMIPLMLISWFVIREFAFSIGPWGRFIGITLMIVYLSLGNSSWGKGQTLGKRVTKIVVVTEGEKYLSIKQSLWRSLMLIFILMIRDWAIPPLQIPLVKMLLSASANGLGLALLYGIIFNRVTRQGVHDLIIGSYVIRRSRLVKVPLQQSSAIHKKVMLGLIVAGVLIGFFSLIIPDFGVKLGFVEAGEWNEMEKLLEVLGNENSLFSVDVRMIREKTVGYPEVVEILEIEVWTKELCTRNLALCKEQMDDIARIALSEYDSIDQLTGMRVIIANRYDLGLTTGQMTYENARIIDDWKRMFQKHRP